MGVPHTIMGTSAAKAEDTQVVLKVVTNATITTISAGRVCRQHHHTIAVHSVQAVADHLAVRAEEVHSEAEVAQVVATSEVEDKGYFN